MDGNRELDLAENDGLGPPRESESIIPTFPPGDPDEPIPIPIPPGGTQPDIHDPNTGTSLPPDGTQVIEPDGKDDDVPPDVFKPPEPPKPLV